MAAVNILIVVDVQNCFIAGGSLGIDSDKISESIKQIREIEELIYTSEHIYFTRDFHPKNHSSLTGENESKPMNFKNIFPNHCRNNLNNCVVENIKKDSKYNEYIPLSNLKKDLNELKIIISDKFYNKKIIGTNISYLFYSTKYADDIAMLTENSAYTIGIKPGDFFKVSPTLSNLNQNK